MLTASNVILTLKVAVVAVTVLLLASLVLLARGNYRWHGRVNTVFFVLTLVALVGLEVVARLISPGMFEEHFTAADAWGYLTLHLCFSLPSAVLLPVMLFTGKTHRGTLHVSLGVLFLVLWTGTFVTGVFFLPH